MFLDIREDGEFESMFRQKFDTLKSDLSNRFGSMLVSEQDYIDYSIKNWFK